MAGDDEERDRRVAGLLVFEIIQSQDIMRCTVQLECLFVCYGDKAMLTKQYVFHLALPSQQSRVHYPVGISGLAPGYGVLYGG